MRIGWIRRIFGNRGERLAARFLKNNGYKILARQARNQFGEIDLIALHGDVIVFVEVKTRRNSRAGHPSEAVDSTKQRQLTRAALAWLKEKKQLNRRGRFDVIAITWNTSSVPVIEHFLNAFEATGRGQMYS
ncbi:YraN family protein [Planctomicrobium sp. SH668]|uniref:YraN family protein n=1 Tax=Planctomicrobium sp. SH668 TaxID=3448126 RepID=UPI003F5C0E42